MRSMRFLGVVALAAISFGCVPEWARDNETGLIMEVAGISGVRGGTQGGATEGSAVLFSDVSAWINDDAIVTVNVYRKNPNVEGTSALEHVRLESYQVRYFRTDGRNVEGLDVPHRHTGPLSSLRFHTPTGTDEIEIDAVINVVRQTAKREPPLINLIGINPTMTRSVAVPSEGIITTVAEITIYGRQVTTGEPLQATGRFSVMFADFVDEE